MTDTQIIAFAFIVLMMLALALSIYFDLHDGGKARSKPRLIDSFRDGRFQL
jgi:hypothetical protein